MEGYKLCVGFVADVGVFLHGLLCRLPGRQNIFRWDKAGLFWSLHQVSMWASRFVFDAAFGVRRPAPRPMNSVWVNLIAAVAGTLTAQRGSEALSTADVGDRCLENFSVVLISYCQLLGPSIFRG